MLQVHTQYKYRQIYGNCFQIPERHLKSEQAQILRSYSKSILDMECKGKISACVNVLKGQGMYVAVCSH